MLLFKVVLCDYIGGVVIIPPYRGVLRLCSFSHISSSVIPANFVWFTVNWKSYGNGKYQNQPSGFGCPVVPLRPLRFRQF